MTFLLTVITDCDIHQKSVCCKSEMDAHCLMHEYADDLHEAGEQVIFTDYSCVANWSPVNHLKGVA